MSHAWGCTTVDCSRDPCVERPTLEPPEPPFFEAAPLLERFDFRKLPIELRLRVLRSTHLGPPETGSYSQSFDKIFVRDGKLDFDNFNIVQRTPFPWFVLPYTRDPFL